MMIRAFYDPKFPNDCYTVALGKGKRNRVNCLCLNHSGDYYHDEACQAWIKGQARRKVGLLDLPSGVLRSLRGLGYIS